MKKALLICADRYPNGDAGAVRTHIFAKMLESMGYKSVVAGLGNSTDFKFKTFDRIDYISLRALSNSFSTRVLNRLRFHNNLKKYLLDEKDWDIILTSEVSEKSFNLLKKYVKKHNIPLLHDSVEWYSPQQFNIGKLHPSYINKNRLNQVIVDEKMKVIAISSYLEKHFISRGLETIRIPVLMDVSNMPCEKHTNPQKTVFAYAGSPGKKDYIKTVVGGFALLSENCKDFELRLIGINPDQLVSLCDVEQEHIKKLGDNLKCLGRVSRDEVLNQLSMADFTVLMRSEEQRYAKAGFPTKFAESLATATPVVANLTSDLHLYLKDGENGFAVKSCSEEDLAETLNRAMKLTYEERSQMTDFARKTAEECFDYSVYTQRLKAFIQE